MLSVQARFLNQIFKSMPAEDINAVHDYEKEREQNRARELPRQPANIIVQQKDFDGVNGEIIAPINADKDKVIWYIHGGGCTTGSAMESRACTYYLAEKFGFTVLASDYRLAPENKWPAQLDDCMTVYESIIKSGYDMSKVVLMGGSAGGLLVLSVALRARDERKIMPKAVCAFSPITNQADDLQSHHGNEKKDYMLKNTLFCPRQNVALFGEANPPRELMAHPYVSPYYGTYQGMPPVFLAVSDCEVLYDDSLSLYHKLKKEGHPVEIDIVKGICHAYATLPMMPEAQKTLKRAIEFAEKAGNAVGA